MTVFRLFFIFNLAPVSDHAQSLAINVTTRHLEMAQNYLKWKLETDRNMAIAVTKALRKIHEGQLIIISSAMK